MGIDIRNRNLQKRMWRMSRYVPCTEAELYKKNPLCKYAWDLERTDCRDDIKKQFRRQNAVGNMLVWKFSFAPTEAKIQLFKSYC